MAFTEVQKLWFYVVERSKRTALSCLESLYVGDFGFSSKKLLHTNPTEV